MANNLTIGVPFNLDESWMGGAYYLQNVLSALETLDSDLQPRIVVITNDSRSYEFLCDSGYAKLSLANSQHLMLDPDDLGIQLLFPYPIQGMENRTLSWIPDFQERHLPYLFSNSEIVERTSWHEKCIQSAGVLLSSSSAYSDLVRFYGESQTPVFVVPFASFLPQDRPSINAIRHHWDIPARYYFCPNHYWIHKNHVVILRALRALRERGVFPQVCFSGKEFDWRTRGYGDYLHEIAADWGVADQVKFMGFIPRDVQVSLLEHAIAILQPSRFEGWSTVVEDAKALNQYVIASSLDVHREQLSSNSEFFHPSDFGSLADILERHWTEKAARTIFDYRLAQRAFGEALVSTFAALACANSGSTRGSGLRENSTVSSSINKAHLFGLSYIEGPYPEYEIKSRFQWIEGNELRIRNCIIPVQKPILRINVRNIVEDQSVSVAVDGKKIGTVTSLPDDILSARELLFDLEQFAGHLCDISVEVSATKFSEGRELGLLIEKIDLVSD